MMRSPSDAAPKSSAPRRPAGSDEVAHDSPSVVDIAVSAPSKPATTTRSPAVVITPDRAGSPPAASSTTSQVWRSVDRATDLGLAANQPSGVHAIDCGESAENASPAGPSRSLHSRPSIDVQRRARDAVPLPPPSATPAARVAPAP